MLVSKSPVCVLCSWTCAPVRPIVQLSVSHKHMPRCVRGKTVVCHASDSSVPNSLLSVLKDEITFAKDSYRRDERLLERPPNEFLLDPCPGQTVFYLLKEYNDKEQIVIKVDLDGQVAKSEDDEDNVAEYEDEHGEDDSVTPVAFVVKLHKAGDILVFDCESNGLYVIITGMRIEVGDDMNYDMHALMRNLWAQHHHHHAWCMQPGDSADEELYTGPAFEDLDDTLQLAFSDFLEERGVTSELGEYMCLMARDKASLEYQGWLQNVCDFVSR